MAAIAHTMPEADTLPEELHRKKRVILRELKDRTLWFVRLRWWVPPSIALGTAAAWLLGFRTAFVPVLIVAAFILVYNVVFSLFSRRIQDEPDAQVQYIQRFTYSQVVADYCAMFLLIHFTGGAASPLIFFFIFHIIFTSILLPPRSAYGFATLAAAGMAFTAGAEYVGWIDHHPIVFRQTSINLAEQPFHVMVELGFFTASVFITAFSTTAIMGMLKRRILDLAELSETLNALNNKLRALYAMTEAILSTQRLEQVLDIVTAELAHVMDVQAISVKLLDKDARMLHYAAAYGLPAEFLTHKVVDVEKSPLNRRIIQGEPFVTGQVSQPEMFQFGEDLAAARIRSVLFVPLAAEEKVLGILGAYCRKPDRFTSDDVEFFRLAAGLVALALENARAYEAIEQLVEERSRFMMRVTHNLRAPLAAMLSILEVVRSGYKGDLNEEQREYLRRIDRRARTMLAMINELMTLAKSRSEQLRPAQAPVNLNVLAGRIQRTFKDEASEKGLTFEVSVPENIPEVWGNQEMIEQLLENLVSNAIKYTPAGGRVSLAASCGTDGMVRIEVSDNGIGIPKSAMPRLFTEFFRAENARSVEEVGTGLGLAIVKGIVEQHGGRIIVESEEGLGTIFVVHLPAHREEAH
jgi:signal transduction histidine kinase